MITKVDRKDNGMRFDLTLRDVTPAKIHMILHALERYGRQGNSTVEAELKPITDAILKSIQEI